MKVACFMLSLATSVAAGDSATAEASFFKRLPNADRIEGIVSATFDDDVCFRVRGTAANGEYLSEVTVYDGAGREVSRVMGPLRVESGRWGRIFCYGFRDEDAPGEWWYVASLNDKPIVSESLIVGGKRP